MKPSRSRIEARASFNFELGIRTVSNCAELAFWILVNMSAIGSVIVMVGPRSPAGLGHARDLPGVNHRTEADPAEPEFSQDRLRAATALAPGISPDLELGYSLLLLDQCLLCHGRLSSLLSEWESERPQERPSVIICASCRHDRDVHPADCVDAVVLNLGEDQLLGYSERVIAASVERSGGKASKVSDTGNGQADETVEELPRPIA